MDSINPKSLLLILTVFTVGIILLQTDPSIENSEYEERKTLHEINYESHFENNYRRQIFLENKAKMIKHNSNPLNTYKMGLNQFSAMTDQEFAEQHLSKVNAPISEIIYV
jgi:hypothetical protein